MSCNINCIPRYLPQYGTVVQVLYKCSWGPHGILYVDPMVLSHGTVLSVHTELSGSGELYTASSLTAPVDYALAAVRPQVEDRAIAGATQPSSPPFSAAPLIYH